MIFTILTVCFPKNIWASSWEENPTVSLEVSDSLRRELAGTCGL